MTTTSRGELATSVAKLDPYVKSTDAGMVLDAPQEVLVEIPADHLNELRTSIAKMNRPEQDEAGQGATALAAAGTGVRQGEHGYLEAHWYGWELGMDPYLCGKVLVGAFGAGALATAVGAGAAGRGAAVIAAAFGLLGAMIMACKHENGWTYLIGMPPFTPGGVVCNPFG